MSKKLLGRWLWGATRVSGVALFAAGLAACSMGSILGGGSGSPSSNSLADTNASQAEIAAAAATALPAIAAECPPIKVRDGGQAIFSYANNKVGSPTELQFQAIIDKESRNCVVSNGLITVKMGVVGRLLLGPKGQPGDYTVPLRFAVERDDMAVFSQNYNLPLTLTSAEQSKEFVKVVDNVAIPYVGGEKIVIWVGFDPKKG